MAGVLVVSHALQACHAAVWVRAFRLRCFFGLRRSLSVTLYHRRFINGCRAFVLPRHHDLPIAGHSPVVHPLFPRGVRANRLLAIHQWRSRVAVSHFSVAYYFSDSQLLVCDDITRHCRCDASGCLNLYLLRPCLLPNLFAAYPGYCHLCYVTAFCFYDSAAEHCRVIALSFIVAVISVVTVAVIGASLESRCYRFLTTTLTMQIIRRASDF